MYKFKLFLNEYIKNINSYKWIKYNNIKIDISNKNKLKIINDAKKTYDNDKINKIIEEFILKYFSFYKDKNYYIGFNYICYFFLLLFDGDKEKAFNILIIFVDKFLDEKIFNFFEEKNSFLIDKENWLIKNLNKIWINENFNYIKIFSKSLITYEYTLLFNWFFLYDKLDNLSLLLFYMFKYNFDFWRKINLEIIKKSINNNNMESFMFKYNKLIKKFTKKNEFFKKIVKKVLKSYEKNYIYNWLKLKKIEIFIFSIGLFTFTIKLIK